MSCPPAPLHFHYRFSASPRLTESPDFDRLAERFRLRLFDNIVHRSLSRSGIRTLTYFDIFECPRDRVLLEQKTVVISHICVILPGAHLRTAAFNLPILNTHNATARTATCPQSHSSFSSSFFTNPSRPRICCARFFVTVIFRQAHTFNRCKIAKFADLGTQIFILLIVQCMSFFNFHPSLS